MDYFKRAQEYADRADKLARMGCHDAARRTLAKAQYWDKRGTRRMHTIEIAFRIATSHEAFAHRCMRRRRWVEWRRWKHSEEDRAFWAEMRRRETELQDMKSSFEATVTHARSLLDREP